jgi:hypothetical protein
MTKKAVSQLQYDFFQDELARLEQGIPGMLGVSIAELQEALDVDRESLPYKAGSKPRGTPQPQPKPQPKPWPQGRRDPDHDPFEGRGFATHYAVIRQAGVVPPERWPAFKALGGYFIFGRRGWNPLTLMQNEAAVQRAIALMPDTVRHQYLTLCECRSFLELGGEQVKTLRQAAELLGSRPPEHTIEQVMVSTRAPGVKTWA